MIQQGIVSDRGGIWQQRDRGRLLDTQLGGFFAPPPVFPTSVHVDRTCKPELQVQTGDTGTCYCVSITV